MSRRPCGRQGVRAVVHQSNTLCDRPGRRYRAARGGAGLFDRQINSNSARLSVRGAADGWVRLGEFNQGFRGAPEQRRRDGTHADGQEVVRGAAAVAELASQRAGFHAQANAVAVAPLRSLMDAWFGQAPEAGGAKDVVQNVLLEAELLGVGGVLVLASSADSEMDAVGFDAMRRTAEGFLVFRPESHVRRAGRRGAARRCRL